MKKKLKKLRKKWKKMKKSKTIRKMYRKVFGLVGKLPKTIISLYLKASWENNTVATQEQYMKK